MIFIRLPGFAFLQFYFDTWVCWAALGILPAIDGKKKKKRKTKTEAVASSVFVHDNRSTGMKSEEVTFGHCVTNSLHD